MENMISWTKLPLWGLGGLQKMRQPPRQHDKSTGLTATTKDPLSLEDLPTELHLEIVSYLSIVDMRQVCRVNRGFLNLMTDQKNRDSLARARIRASQIRFQEIAIENDLISGLPFAAAVKRFFNRRGVHRERQDRMHAAFVFAKLRLCQRTYLRPDRREVVLYQTAWLVYDLLDLHMWCHIVRLVPNVYVRWTFMPMFAEKTLRRYSALNMRAGTLVFMYYRITARGGWLPTAFVDGGRDNSTEIPTYAMTPLPLNVYPGDWPQEILGLGSTQQLSQALQTPLPQLHEKDHFGYGTDSRWAWQKVKDAMRSDGKPLTLVEKAKVMELMVIFERP